MSMCSTLISFNFEIEGVFLANPFRGFPRYFMQKHLHTLRGNIGIYITNVLTTHLFFSFWRVYVQCIGREYVNAVSIACKVATAAPNEDVNFN